MPYLYTTIISFSPLNFLFPEAPDLVPDLEEFERSLRYYPYLDQQIIYYLTCAREENCLASSALGKSVNHMRLVSL